MEVGGYRSRTTSAEVINGMTRTREQFSEELAKKNPRLQPKTVALYDQNNHQVDQQP
jgi:hypothetical protein